MVSLHRPTARGQAGWDWLTFKRMRAGRKRRRLDSGQKDSIQIIHLGTPYRLAFRAPSYTAQIGTFTHYVMQQLDVHQKDWMSWTIRLPFKEQAQAWLAMALWKLAVGVSKLASICQFWLVTWAEVLIKQANPTSQ